MTRPLAILDWNALDAKQRATVLRRPAQREAATLRERAARIVDDVRERGDDALRDYTAQLDKVRLDSFAVGSAEFAAA
ncbi:MAG: histidinol dehydrogenase, partial [Steroidobacteraceae bacterium]|nr:histidinol dehydrogenase [Steroidobacteraceae bacterium]